MADRSNSAMVWGIGALVAALLVMALWWCRDGEVASPVAGLAPAAVVEASVPLAEPASGRDLLVLPDTKVTGCVLDCAGQPLAGAVVVLQRQVPESERLVVHPPVSSTTDARGEFSFRGLAAADYEIWAKAHSSPSLPLSLASGETRRCELRLAAPTVTVSGRVLFPGPRGGLVRVAILGRHRGGEVELMKDIDSEGAYRCVVPPGLYVVSVRRWLELRGNSAAWVVAAERSIVAADDARDVRCDFDLPGTRLAVRVEDPKHSALGPLVIHAASACGVNAAQIEIVRSATAGRAAVIDNLPLGEWRVFARAEGIVEALPQAVTLTAEYPDASVVLTAEPAGHVNLSLLGKGGRPFAAFAEALPVLVAGGREFASWSVFQGEEVVHFVGSGYSGNSGYSGVPLGRAELRLEDRVVEGRWSFLAFDSLAPVLLDVVQGSDNRVEVQVEPRACVGAHALGQDDGLDLLARLTVFAGARQVRSCETPVQPHRWLGYLPPGSYLAVVERPGGRSERAFAVAREDLNLQLRP